MELLTPGQDNRGGWLQDRQSLLGPLRGGPDRANITGNDMDMRRFIKEMVQYQEHNIHSSAPPTSTKAKVAVATLIGSLRLEWARAEHQDRNG